MSSRGRGVSNVPAWMTRDQQQNANPNNNNNDSFVENGLPPPSNKQHDHHDGVNVSPSSQRHSHSRDRGDPRDRYDRRYDRGYDDRRYRGGSGGGGGHHHHHHHRSSSSRSNHPHNNRNRSGIYFNSYQEERNWIEERRRKRQSRISLFDVLPTPEQLVLEELQKAALASSGPNPSVFLRPEEMKGRMMGSMENGLSSSGRNVTLDPQQTRHARRIYVGNLPDGLSNKEIQDFFTSAIHTALGVKDAQHNDENDEINDPILSVYINEEKKFAFVEFKSVDMCTACMGLDGIDINGKGIVKIKRPNDYNASLATMSSYNSDLLNRFDVSKLGLISSHVPDSPNKIFIGGLPYHLSENEVLELLRAFGEVKAFNLVKADPMATTSKGYCFVEYADSNAKDIAVMGLNGMDMGGGKQLSAKLASTNNSNSTESMSSIGMQPINTNATSAPPIMKVVDGVDIEALLDVAMGRNQNQNNNNINYTAYNMQNNNSQSSNVLDIANAALAAAYGGQ